MLVYNKIYARIFTIIQLLLSFIDCSSVIIDYLNSAICKEQINNLSTNERTWETINSSLESASKTTLVVSISSYFNLYSAIKQKLLQWNSRCFNSQFCFSPWEGKQKWIHLGKFKVRSGQFLSKLNNVCRRRLLEWLMWSGGL